MLWYKAWLETRIRFLIFLIGVTVFCAYSVYRMDSGVTSRVNAAFYNSVVHGRDGQLGLWWLLAVNLLAMGGLLREKAVGAASFTLGLPFSRARLTAVRMAMSLAQAITLLVVPWSAIFLTGQLFATTPGLPQALFHLALMTSGGVLMYAIAFLVSALFEGEYTAPMISGGIALAIALDFGTDLDGYNPVAFMAGVDRYERRTGLLTGPIPWTQIFFFCALGILLLFLSVKAIERREF